MHSYSMHNMILLHLHLFVINTETFCCTFIHLSQTNADVTISCYA